jgi:RNA polymerase sigma factor (sigma-70 family)
MLAGSRTDAEDALQDVFLRAYSALRSDDRPVTLRAWLYRVAHNRCVDELRRPLPAPADVFDLTRTPLHDPLAEAERREDLRRLVADVRRLPEQQRSALLMRELEGLSYHELADALGVTLPAVKSLLVRARIGLVEAGEARDTACGVIRGDILDAHDRGARCDSRTRRHLHDCGGCRDYHDALRAARRRLAAFSPGCGPLATLAKLVGLGGAGSGAAAGAGSAAGGGAVAGGVAAGTATKVAAVICCAAVVGGAGVGKELRDRHRDAAPERAATGAGPPAAAALSAPDRLIAIAGPDARAARPAAGRERAREDARRRAAATDERSEVVVEVLPPVSPPDPDAAARVSAERATGGAAAPDEEDLAGEPVPEDGSAPSGAATDPGPEATEVASDPAGSAVSAVTAAGTDAPGGNRDGTSAGAHSAVAAGAPAAADG